MIAFDRQRMNLCQSILPLPDARNAGHLRDMRYSSEMEPQIFDCERL
jgi:hypothetical protein